FEMEDTANHFFEKYLNHGSNIPSLADIVQFNKDNAALCFPAPGQAWLAQALEEKPAEGTKAYKAAFIHMCQVGNLAEQVFEGHNFDILLAPLDSNACALSTVSGCPIANVPLERFNYKGEFSRHFELAVLAKRGGVVDLLRFMAALEAHFPKRKIPGSSLFSMALT
ncbi:hypothetical protein BJ878DRAFT_414870, partial [Calycina marina]